VGPRITRSNSDFCGWTKVTFVVLAISFFFRQNKGLNLLPDFGLLPIDCLVLNSTFSPVYYQNSVSLNICLKQIQEILSLSFVFGKEELSLGPRPGLYGPERP